MFENIRANTADQAVLRDRLPKMRFTEIARVHYSKECGYGKVLNFNIYPLFNPVMKSVSRHVRQYMTDFLYDFDGIKMKAEKFDASAENFLLGLIGVRELGTDGEAYFCHREEAETKMIYKDLFIYEARMIDGYPTIILWKKS